MARLNDGERSRLEYPARPIFPVQKLIGRLRVQNSSAERVIFDRAFDESGQIDELHQFSQWAANFKTGKSFSVAFASFDPFAVVPGRSGQGLRLTGLNV